MSIKENMDYVKSELSTQEKFIESLVRVEGVYKKNKKIIYTIIAVVVVIFISYKISGYINEQNLIKSNLAYDRLLKNPDDKESLSILKSTNNNLYEVYRLSNAISLGDSKELSALSTSSVEFVKDIASYEVAISAQDSSAIKKYSLKESALLRDLAIFKDVVEMIKAKDYKNAKLKIGSISKDTPLSKSVDAIKHFLITK